jgi:hypothetical protein
MKFTRIPTDTFKKLQMNAGVVATDFTPGTGTLNEADILGATTGGLTVTAAPEFSDLGEDIDNCPKNTKELKELTGWTVTASGTLVTITAAATRKLLAAADLAGNKITPRVDLAAEDFGDIWIIGDYTNDNSEENGGFVACHVINALSTGGFSLVTSDGQKGQFAFEFTGHVSINEQDVVPFEMYVKAGGEDTGASDVVDIGTVDSMTLRS